MSKGGGRQSAIANQHPVLFLNVVYIYMGGGGGDWVEIRHNFADVSSLLGEAMRRISDWSGSDAPSLDVRSMKQR